MIISQWTEGPSCSNPNTTAPTGRVECRTRLHTGTQTLATLFKVDGASAMKSSMIAQTHHLQITYFFMVIIVMK